MKQIYPDTCQGYIEGYYGKLLSWAERKSIVHQLHAIGFSHYFYAPKEDIFHRLQWREPYPAQWREQFSAWASDAKSCQVNLIAGLAPGLDFDFTHLNSGDDFIALVNKAKQLLEDGAGSIALLMDDINAEYKTANATAQFEGQAHAQLANALSEAIDSFIYIVPRVYAKELEHESLNYAHSFSHELHEGHVVFHCGTHIVAPNISNEDYADFAGDGRHRIVVWDNLYANDYCPRRLFLGSWLGRQDVSDVMLNPTGMPATDSLLLEIMANTLHGEDSESAWIRALDKHEVPDEFHHIAEYFYHPPFEHLGVSAFAGESSLEQQLSAIEFLLWKWKSPLSREWYPYLFGLKHDLLISAKQLPELRIRKTQLSPLVRRLSER